MIGNVKIEGALSLDEYAEHAHLAHAVAELRREAAKLGEALVGRTVWMVNSTARGGGVAEMLPRQISILNELGVHTRWVVVGTERKEFFDLTKRIHNLIHGEGDPKIDASDRELYETVSKELAAELEPRLGAHDILVVHDPQPAGMGARIRERRDITAVWRCHIGLDTKCAQTEAAWRLLQPYVREYDHMVFTAPEYIPNFATGRVSLITPGIDPLSQKNRTLSAAHLTGVLCNSGLMREHSPVLPPSFQARATRLQQNGEFGDATAPDEIGLLFRPMVSQISRWDRLKGYRPLLDAFVKLKREYHTVPGLDGAARRRFELVRLVLAGPEPKAVADDPEAKGVLEELCSAWLALEPDVQKDVILLSLPMDSTKENALMVNAIQSCSSIVVQNSLREGFGLTVTEAMWKRVPVLGSPACGIRHQIRDGIDGRLHHDATDPDAIASALVHMLSHPEKRAAWGRTGQRRVHDEFLIFSQLRRWLRALATAADASSLAPPRPSVFPSSRPRVKES
jgi:trehalose synthase